MSKLTKIISKNEKVRSMMVEKMRPDALEAIMSNFKYLHFPVRSVMKLKRRGLCNSVQTHDRRY